MKKNLKFFAAAIAAIALIGCAKNGGDAKIETPDNGVETTASFRITTGSATRAILPGSATAPEKFIKDAWAFIFHPTTERLLAKVELEAESDGSGASKSNVRTTTGNKIVFVAVNAANNFAFANDTAFPIDVADDTNPIAGMFLSDFMKAVIDDLANDLPAEKISETEGYFLMTGYNNAVNFVAPTTAVPNPDNKAVISVGRGVAKVHLQDANVSALADEITFDQLAYKVINNPVEMYAFQKYEPKFQTGTIVNKITGDGVIRSNYYYNPTALLGQGYQPESAKPTVGLPTAGLYVPENWNEVPTTHNATTLLIQGRVVFTGVEFLDKDGAATTYTNGTDFYRVWDKTNKKWLDRFFAEVPELAAIATWTLEALTADDIAISTKKTEQETTGIREFFIAKYTNGKCYWTLPLKNEQLGRSVVARNDYFWVTMKTIKGIGASSDDEDGEDGILPKDPEPIDETEVLVEVEIEMLDWNFVDQEGNI